MIRCIQLPDGRAVPALGQGTWFMGENRAPAAQEADALRLGIDLGMTLIDTAEMYADGGAEKVVAQAIAGQRDRAFIVSKVYPHNASRAGVVQACERSLARLRTERIDLYLLHWRGSVQLGETVSGFEALMAQGKIGGWGVSNLDAADMAELAGAPGGKGCAVDQVLYNPEHRGIEFDLLPACAAKGIAVMAYSPLGQAGRLLASPALATVARRHGVSPAQVAVAWGLRQPGVISIPKATNPLHVHENATAAEIVLDAEDLAAIDAAHPPPRRRRHLSML